MIDLLVAHATLAARNAFLRTSAIRQMEILIQRDLEWSIHEAIETTKSGAGR